MMKARRVGAVILAVVALAVCAEAKIETLQIYSGATLPDGNVYGVTTPTGTESFWMRSADDIGVNNVVLRVGEQSGDTYVARTLIRYPYINLVHHGIDLGILADDIVGGRLILLTRGLTQGSGTMEMRVLGDSDEEWTDTYSKWSMRRTDLGDPWDGGPGAGSNYGPVIDTFSWTHEMPSETEIAFEITGGAVDVVKNWVSGDDTTDAFMLKSAAEAGNVDDYVDMYSETETTVGYRPVLEIDHFVPDEGTVIAVR